MEIGQLNISSIKKKNSEDDDDNVRQSLLEKIVSIWIGLVRIVNTLVKCIWTIHLYTKTVYRNSMAEPDKAAHNNLIERCAHTHTQVNREVFSFWFFVQNTCVAYYQNM